MQDLGAIANAAVLIRDGLVVEVGTARRVENLAAARHAREVSAGGRMVMPAFVDPFFEPLTPEGADRSESVGRLQQRVSAFLKMALLHGTTCFELKSGTRAEVQAQIRALRAFRAISNGPWELRSTFSAAEPGSGELCQALARRGLAANIELSGEHLSLAEEAISAGLPLKIYAGGETKPSGLRSALRLGAVAVDGLESATELDIQALSISHTIAVLTPVLGGNTGLARALVDSGAVLALATGFGHRIPCTYSQQAVIEMATSRLGLSIEESLTAATVNAAWAVGLARQRGTIEPGKTADLIALNCPSYQDFHNTLGVNRVALVMKSGVVVKEPGGEVWKNSSWSV